MRREAASTVLDAEDVLRKARTALDEGEVDFARELAQAALSLAEGNQDRLLQAKALLCLGHCDRFVSGFRRAHDACQKAAHLFRMLGDPVGEAEALSTLSHTATCLGRNEEAVEAALLAVRLGESSPSASHKAMLLNYLGVAYLWSRSFDKADATFEASISMADGAGPESGAFQPILSQMCLEVMRRATERYQTGRVPALDRMAFHENRYATRAKAGEEADLFKGYRIARTALWFLASALLRCWQGDQEAAVLLLGQGQAWASQYKTNTWLESFEHWIRMELAWATQDWKQAAEHCATLIEVAKRHEYEQLVCIGYMFASQIHEHLGEYGEALDALRKLRRREELIRAESLESRERVVQWHLDMRRSQDSVLQLQSTSRHLERLSLEDPLTGIANRRCFEQQLSSLLSGNADAGPPLSVAFIDVDGLKQINDGHSHLVGDQVLTAIANLLVQNLREQDLAARLAGDEFAILFQHADASQAEHVCERISDMVRSFAWDAIAQGLSVTVSAGTTAAHLGDTVESLLHRGDLAMYAGKRRNRSG
jgi:diguanylate cyclase (GGDEF)-like protein